MIVRKTTKGRVTTGRLFFGGRDGVTIGTSRNRGAIEDRREGAPTKPPPGPSDETGRDPMGLQRLYDPKVLAAAAAKARHGKLRRGKAF